MKLYRFLVLLLMVNMACLAQVKKIVKDSLTKEVIPFASVFFENTKRGLISDENGSFQISNLENDGEISITAVGYQKKTIKIKSNLEILLKPIAYELEEVTISNNAKLKVIEIGLTKDKYLQAFENGAKYEAKYFPYFAKYKKTNFIKYVTFHTENKLEKAQFKVHFYNVNSNGLPDKELVDRDCVVTVKLGSRKTSFNISYLNLEMPESGLFVAFEKLIIESNKFEKKNPNNANIQTTFQPNIFYNNVEKTVQFKYVNGKWLKKQNADNTTLLFYEPAIYLTLTN